MNPLQIQQRGKVLCVRVSGRLAQEESVALARQVTPRLKPGCDLLLDLGEVEYMTSAAVGALVGLYQQVRLAGGRAAISAPNERVHLLLEIAGLNQLLALCRSLEEAEGQLGSGSGSASGTNPA